MKNIFGSYFLFILKNTKNTKYKEQKQFSKNTKMVLFIFSKSVLNKHF